METPNSLVRPFIFLILKFVQRYYGPERVTEVNFEDFTGFACPIRQEADFKITNSRKFEKYRPILHIMHIFDVELNIGPIDF